MYLVYCKYIVKYPVQVRVFHSCRIPEKASASVLNCEALRAGTVMVMASEVLSYPPWHIVLFSESGTAEDQKETYLSASPSFPTWSPDGLQGPRRYLNLHQLHLYHKVQYIIWGTKYIASGIPAARVISCFCTITLDE